jgi:hypothetical protein
VPYQGASDTFCVKASDFLVIIRSASLSTTGTGAAATGT